MGLIDDLGYDVKPANGFHRAIRRFGSTRPAGWFLSRTLYPFDKTLFKLTGGRVTLAGSTAGLPVIMLTTIGANSGAMRTMPLIGIPLACDLAIIGTNYGLEKTPGWVYNLEAHPVATVRYRNTAVAVTARRVEEHERERVFDLASGLFPGFAEYRLRAGHRVVRVFILESSA